MQRAPKGALCYGITAERWEREMKKEIADQWVAALRSGEFTQGDQVLTQVHDDGTKTYCCLGVLSELACRAGVIAAPTEEKTMIERDGVQEEVTALIYGGVASQSKTIAPGVVVEWAGLSHGNPITDDFGSRTLAGLNDGGYTFAQIADIIERDWRTL
jgi:uncharacterized Ntn-hydrolase superfamily protein